ncbi:Speckle-type POZ protein [Araneus ventricosus]|uniref:Speckle-type POZ protein n=1 Tax=Araneus ventricosus TaxID=182803 RepID=A0A4Y2JQB7_ARAVE|nr:Speckle-type POZ protein [Araneus ventricosus]GBO37648.1 Speckle-type POZ protein [Araneus ventricosus]
MDERIESPAFNADALEGTKWSLRLYPVGNTDANYVSFFLKREKDCSGPENFEVNLQLAFLGKDGSIVKEITSAKCKFMKYDSWGVQKFEELERLFVTERETFLPEDTLTVQCTLWTSEEKPDKSKYLFASTAIKVERRSFVWKIDKASTLKSCIRNKFKDNLIDFDLVLNEGFDRLDINMTSFDETIKYISCNTSVIDSKGRKKSYGSKKYFSCDLKKGVLSFMLLFPEMLMEDKSRYFPNDVLSLDFEFVLATVEHFGCRIKYPKLENGVVGEKTQNTAVLIADFKTLYNDGIFSDIELRTSTKSFPAHKNILSARSLVFRRMFGSVKKEKNSGYVDITDFEAETIHRMLLYIYTDSMENLQFESASKLYVAADKYELLSLKSRCSSVLKENLCPENACDVYVLADLHNDDDLKSSVQDYILGQREEFFFSQEWKNLMTTHPKLAENLMYRKITNNKMYLPRKRKSE